MKNPKLLSAIAWFSSQMLRFSCIAVFVCVFCICIWWQVKWVFLLPYPMPEFQVSQVFFLSSMISTFLHRWGNKCLLLGIYDCIPEIPVLFFHFDFIGICVKDLEMRIRTSQPTSVFLYSCFHLYFCICTFVQELYMFSVFVVFHLYLSHFPRCKIQ